MSELTLQHEIEAQRPATEGTLQQVAKGIPLMGRDPDGEAKIINVDENGNVKVQLSGTIMEFFGATIDERPPANSVPVGAIYMAVNTQEVWQSNGIEWVVM